MELAVTTLPSRPAILTKKKHLYFISLRHLIALQLIFNLLIPLFPLLLLCTHPTTHLDGCLKLSQLRHKREIGNRGYLIKRLDSGMDMMISE